MEGSPGISEFFTDALLPAYAHAEARRRMMARRHVPLPPHPPAHARKLWYALLLFMYPEEEGASDEVWVHSRSVVLGLLRRDLGEEAARSYLVSFDLWAGGERAAWVREVAGTLYNLEQIGLAVQGSGESWAEWEPLHTTLRGDILAAMQRVNLADDVLRAVGEVGAARDRGVADHLRRAYWDSLALDLDGGRPERVMAQIHEVRMQLRAIVPPARHAAEIDSWLDLELIAQSLHMRSPDEGDAGWLRDMEEGALRVLREYDSDHLRPQYDSALALHRDGPGLDVMGVLKNVTVLTNSLYQRTRAWRHILRT